MKVHAFSMVILMTVFQLFCCILVISSSLIGFLGAASIADILFGVDINSPSDALSVPELISVTILLAIGTMFSGFGSMILVVLPLSVLFPKISEPFGWQLNKSKVSYRFISMYAQKLKQYADKRNA